MNESKEIIYANILLTNPTGKAIRCDILSRRNEALLTNAKEWKMAVVRFDMNSGLPMLEADPYHTIGMKIGAAAYNNTIVPLYNPTFYLEPSEVIRALNNALMLAYTSLIPSLPPACQFPPVFHLRDNKVTLYFPVAYIANGVEIFVSRDTYNDMTPAIPINSSMLPPDFINDDYFAGNGQDIFYDLANQAIQAPPAPRYNYPLSISTSTADYAFLESIDANLANLSSINLISLFSSNLPIRSELDGSNSPAISTDTSSKLSDFVVSPQSPYETRVLLEYLPTSQYRWIELVGSGSIKDIHLEVFYTTKYGTIFPFYILPGTHLNIKMCFSRI